MDHSQLLFRVFRLFKNYLGKIGQTNEGFELHKTGFRSNRTAIVPQSNPSQLNWFSSGNFIEEFFDPFELKGRDSNPRLLTFRKDKSSVKNTLIPPTRRRWVKMKVKF